MHKWIDHIVVRVKDLDAARQDYERKLGMKAKGDVETFPELGLKRVVLPIGDEGRFIELAEPIDEDSAIGKALGRQGEGLHLVAIAVDDLEKAKAQMKAEGTQIIEAERMVFIHPKETHGILYQLVERT